MASDASVECGTEQTAHEDIEDMFVRISEKAAKWLAKNQGKRMSEEVDEGVIGHVDGMWRVGGD